MKKVQQSFLVLALFLMSVMAYAVSEPQDSRRQVQAHPISPVQGSKPPTRMPAAPIIIIQEGHNFYFDNSHIGEMVVLRDGNIIIYSSIIEENCSIEVPASIAGDVEILLVCENLCYSAIVEL